MLDHSENQQIGSVPIAEEEIEGVPTTEVSRGSPGENDVITAKAIKTTTPKVKERILHDERKKIGTY